MPSMEYEIEIRRSEKRRKTISAKLIKNRLIIQLPSGLSRDEEEKWIEKIKKRVEKKRIKKQLDNAYLRKGFDFLNKKYFNGKLKIKSIEFSTDQEKRRGSCSPESRTIRISYKLASMPAWVIDYVIMHEMTHLIHAPRCQRFC